MTLITLHSANNYMLEDVGMISNFVNSKLSVFKCPKSKGILEHLPINMNLWLQHTRAHARTHIHMRAQSKI